MQPTSSFSNIVVKLVGERDELAPMNVWELKIILVEMEVSVAKQSTGGGEGLDQVNLHYYALLLNLDIHRNFWLSEGAGTAKY